MHDDDEKRFPRITLWQFLSGIIMTPLRFWDRWFGVYGIDALASLAEKRKRKSSSKSAEVRPPGKIREESRH